jgi:hypothetical protein
MPKIPGKEMKKVVTLKNKEKRKHENEYLPPHPGIVNSDK